MDRVFKGAPGGQGYKSYPPQEEDELMKELPQREEASASAVGVTYRAAVGAALAAAAVSTPSGGLFFQVMHGMCGRLMRHPGKGAVWKGDLLLGVASLCAPGATPSSRCRPGEGCSPRPPLAPSLPCARAGS